MAIRSIAAREGEGNKMRFALDDDKAPMLVVPFSAFAKLGKIPQFRDGLAVPYASLAMSKAKKNVVIFVSRAWCGEGPSERKPDGESNELHGLIVTAVKRMARTTASDVQFHLWIDYSCINHDDSVAHEAGLGCTHAYMERSDAMLVIYSDLNLRQTSPFGATTKAFEGMGNMSWTSKSPGMGVYVSRAWCLFELLCALWVPLPQGRPKHAPLGSERQLLFFGSAQVPTDTPPERGPRIPLPWFLGMNPTQAVVTDLQDLESMKVMLRAVGLLLKTRDEYEIKKILDVGKLQEIVIDVYDGERNEEGLPHGQGKMTYANGDSYAGSWDEGKFEGSGVFCDYSTGNTYDGAWVAGKREGQGKIVTLEGDEYTGEWIDGVKSGSGTQIFANGDEFRGTFVDGRPQGQGQLIYCNGDEFEGEIHRGKPKRGRLTLADGSCYEGPFENGLREGQGTMNYASSGDEYDGNWVAGKRQGPGTLNMKDGSRFIGNFHMDHFHGAGKHYYPNNDYFEGNWLKGKRHGAGVLRFSDKKKNELRQVWDSDTLIKEIRSKVTVERGSGCTCSIS